MEDKDYQIGRKILKLAHIMVKKSNAHMKAVDLTNEQTISLIHAADCPGRTINDLKDHLGISHQATQGIVKRMAAKGLLSLEKSERDGREKILVVTEKGMRIRRHLVGDALETGLSLLEGVSEEEKEIFYRVLLKALDNVAPEGKADR